MSSVAYALVCKLPLHVARQVPEVIEFISPPIIFASMFMIFLNCVMGYLTAETVWGAESLAALEMSSATVATAFGLYCSIGSPYDKNANAVKSPTWDALFLGSMIWASSVRVLETPDALVDYTIEGAILVASEGTLNEQEVVTEYTLLMKKNVRIFAVYFVFLTYLAKVLLQVFAILRVFDIVTRELGVSGVRCCQTSSYDDIDSDSDSESDSDSDGESESGSDSDSDSDGDRHERSRLRTLKRDIKNAKQLGKKHLSLGMGVTIDLTKSTGEIFDSLHDIVQSSFPRRNKIESDEENDDDGEEDAPHPSIVDSCIKFVLTAAQGCCESKKITGDENDSAKEDEDNDNDEDDDKDGLVIDGAAWSLIHHGTNLLTFVALCLVMIMYFVVDEISISSRIDSGTDMFNDVLDVLLQDTSGDYNVTAIVEGPDSGTWAAALARSAPYLSYFGTLALLIPVPFVHDLRAATPLFTVALFQMLIAMDRGGREDVWFDMTLVLLCISVTQIATALSYTLTKRALRLLTFDNGANDAEARADGGLFSLVRFTPIANVLYKVGLVLCIMALAFVLVSINFDWMGMDFEPSPALKATGDKLETAKDDMENAMKSLSKLVSSLDPCYQDTSSQPTNLGGVSSASSPQDIEAKALEQRRSMYETGSEEVRECFVSDPSQNDYNFDTGSGGFCEDIRDGFSQGTDTAKTSVGEFSFDASDSVAGKSHEELTMGEINWSCRKTMCDVVLSVGIAAFGVASIPFCGPIGFALKIGSEVMKGVVDIALTIFRANKALALKLKNVARIAIIIARLVKKTRKLIGMLAWLNIVFIPLLLSGTVALMLVVTRRDLNPNKLLRRAVEARLRNRRSLQDVAAIAQELGEMDRLRAALKLAMGLWAPILIANVILSALVLYWPIAFNAILDSLPKDLVSARMEVRVGLVALQLAYALCTVGSLLVLVSAILVGSETAVFSILAVPLGWIRGWSVGFAKSVRRGLADVWSDSDSENCIEEREALKSQDSKFGRLLEPTAATAATAAAPISSERSEDPEDGRVYRTWAWVKARLSEASLRRLNNIWVHALLFNIPVFLFLLDLAIYRKDAAYLHFGYTGNDDLKTSREDYVEARTASQGAVTLREGMEDSLCGLVAQALEAILREVLGQAEDALKVFAEGMSSAMSEAAKFFDVFDVDLAYGFVRLDYDLFSEKWMEKLFALGIPGLNTGLIGAMYVGAFFVGDKKVEEASGTMAMFILQLASTNFLIHMISGSIFGLIESAKIPFISVRVVLGETYYLSLMASVFHVVSALSVYVNIQIKAG